MYMNKLIVLTICISLTTFCCAMDLANSSSNEKSQKAGQVTKKKVLEAIVRQKTAVGLRLQQLEKNESKPNDLLEHLSNLEKTVSAIKGAATKFSLQGSLSWCKTAQSRIENLKNDESA